MRIGKTLAWMLVVLAVVFTATLSEAQRRRSGGSAGGSHFGRSSSGSHFGGSSSGSRSRGSSSRRSGGSSFGFGGGSGGTHSYGGGNSAGNETYDPGYRPNGFYDRGDGWNAFVFLFFIVGGVGLWFAFRRKPGAKETGDSWEKVDITQVRLVLAADARPFLQQKLLALAESADTRSLEGLHRLLGHTARALAMAESAWLYASVSNHQPTDSPLAQSTYERLAQDARAQFTDEVIRSAQGKVVSGPATGLRSDRAQDGEGVIVVTFVVAAKRVIRDVTSLKADELRALLAELIRTPAAMLVGFEVSWMPAEPEDRMSTLAVEALFPSLTKLPGVIGGHRICAYCKGPHTAELAACPHCGAPVTPER